MQKLEISPKIKITSSAEIPNEEDDFTISVADMSEMKKFKRHSRSPSILSTIQTLKKECADSE